MKRNGFQICRQLIGLVKPLTGYMILAIALGLMGHLCAAFITILGGYAILQVLQAQPIHLIFVAAVVFALVRGFLRYGEQACNHYIAFKILALLRDKVFCVLRKLCPAKLEGKDKGNLISMITADIELLEVFYAHTISPIAIAALFCGIMICFIGSYHWFLGIIALLAYATVGILIPLITSKRSGDSGLNFRNQSGELSSFMLDSLRGLSETMQYSQGQQRLHEIHKKTDALSRAEERLNRSAGANAAVTGAVILIFDIAMLFISAILCGFEGCLIATLALMSSFGPAVALAALGATLQNTFAAGNRILDLLEESPVVEEIVGEDPISFQGAAAENVTFAYDRELILKDVTLEIPRQQILGITGRSGSGKSTLLKLFMRFWQTQQGKISVSGRNVNRINTKDLRDMESFMTQETHLFHDSIRNNLLIAKPDATEDEIISACQKASIHDFILSLPQGYDTQVAELGDSLSGGERQRLGLARAFLHNAPFLLLDEPTSNLDSLNEAVILKALHQARNDKTIVLVSHRKSTMGIADRIYSAENGRVS